MSNVTYVHDGNAIDYTPGTAVNAGDVIVQEDLVGVAKRDIAANEQGALHVCGVFDFEKDVGTAMTAGKLAYWDNTAKEATETATSNKLIGKIVASALAANTTVRVRMDQ